jgi:hypothetical protein
MEGREMEGEIRQLAGYRVSQSSGAEKITMMITKMTTSSGSRTGTGHPQPMIPFTITS